MNFLELAKNRYATKSYNGEKISEEKINQLTEILRLGPSSINCQPWRFFFISDEKIKSKLAKVSMINDTKINQSSHLVVFCGFSDLQKLENQLEETLPKEWLPFYYNVVKTSDEAAQSWVEKQVYLSLGYFLSACASMDIDATPMEGIFPTEYDKILNLTDSGYKTLCAVAIGYRNPDDEFQPSKFPKQRLDLEKVITKI